ncbi:hypothetical protein [Nocardioides sp. J54]|uniref:hypothetical protein n=1 Tax=Nocardioides sp. J54 TaxID=935866 RepID=UPI0012FBDD87|nr:hypothetical protein [Nocardioides sp. J54]
MNKKKAAVVGGTVAVLVTGGVAFAYWTSTGTGTGSAEVGTSLDWKVEIDAVPGTLAPGSGTVEVDFHVTNESDGVQNLQGAVATVVDTSDPGCTAADFAISNTSVTTGDVASSGTVDGTFELEMLNRAVNQDACKGATVNLQVSVN